MIPQEIKKEIADKILAVPTFAKHLAKHGEVMGSNLVMLAPVTIWANHIEVMCDTSRNVFRNAIKKIMADDKRINYAKFVKGHGFTPYIYFGITQAI